MRIPILARFLLAVILIGSLLAGLSSGFTTNVRAQEEQLFIQVYATALNEEGSAYEINAGVDGRMYVSDNLAGEIHSYYANGDSVRIFSGLGAVTDARPDAQGMVWFVDQATNRLKRLNPNNLQVIYWTLPTSEATGFGTALAGDGRLWISDFNNPRFFSFDLLSSEMCSYATSELAITGSPYILAENGEVWFSDFWGNAVIRFEPEQNNLTRWKIPSTATSWDFEAEGLTTDGAGGMWFADSSTSALGHLDLSTPEAPRFLKYSLPSTYGRPVMLVKQGNLLWYNNQINPALGYLDPNSAAYTVHIPEVTTAAVTPDCTPADPSPPVTATARTVTQVPWAPVTHELFTPLTGWAVIPIDPLASPWDLAYQQGTVWAVDNGRNMLLRIRVGATVQACTSSDEDGDLATTADRLPLADWSLALRLDGVGHSTGPTGADGCKTWQQLDIGQVAVVREEQRDGWEALTPVECELGLLTLPRIYTCEFINTLPAEELYLPLIRSHP